MPEAEHAKTAGEAGSWATEAFGDRSAAQTGLAAARGVLEALRGRDWGAMVDRLGQDFPPAVGPFGDLVELRAICSAEDGARVMVTTWDEATQQAVTAAIGLEACWRLACSALAAIEWVGEAAEQ